jgi:hypothetical protein
LTDNSVVKKYDFQLEDHPGHLGSDGDLLYYVLNNGIYTINLNDESPEPALLVQTDVMVTYGFNVIDDKIYIADAKDYVSDGDIKIYSLDGTLENTYTVEMLPNGFYKNEEEMGVTDSSLTQLRIYPNPASTVFYVDGKDISKVEIYDLAGRLVKSTSNISNGISVSEFSKGIYLLKIQSGKSVNSKKLIIK